MAKGFGGGHFGTQHFGQTNGMPVDLAPVSTRYQPRQLVTFQIGTIIIRYSTDDVEIATGGGGGGGGEYGEEYGHDYGG